MALSATIYKATVELSDLNRHFYHQFQLTIAKHPSENEVRLMYRLVAFLFAAHENLKFTKGLSTSEEPEIWQHGPGGDIIQWIEMGLPEPKRLKQASGKSKVVKVFTYGQGRIEEWKRKLTKECSHLNNLETYHLELSENDPLEKLLERNMNLSCLIEENSLYLSNDSERIGVLIRKD